MEDANRQYATERTDRAINLAIVIGVAVVLAIIYGPLLLWLGRTTLTVEQLHNGGLIVLFALLISLRRAIQSHRSAPEANQLGIALMLVGIGCLYLLKWAPALALPLALLSFCLSFAGFAAFLFGASGVRALLPAIAGILVLGILAGVAPSLDWPLRSIGARLGARLLEVAGVDVKVALFAGRPPELLLAVRDRIFVVAAECNGFGLLTSSLLAAAILGFHYRLRWYRKLLLLILAVPLAVLFNAFRIFGISWVASHTRLPYVLIHEGIGIFFYVAALGLLWWLAQRHALPEPEVPAAANAEGDPGPDEDRANR